MPEIKKYAPAIYLEKNGYEGCRARIFLYGENGKFLGTISFHDAGVQPPPTGVGANGELFASCLFGIYDDAIDLLRHEGPVFYERINNSTRLTCGQEPAGEAET